MNIINFPDNFVALKRYPGYFWNNQEQKLYSIKSGVLKQLKRNKANRFVIWHSDYYIVYNKGKAYYILINQIDKYITEKYTIPKETNGRSY